MVNLADFNILTGLAALVAAVGTALAYRLDRGPDTPTTRLTFDLVRTAVLYALGVVTVGLAQWVDPVSMGAPWNPMLSVMATSTLMTFVMSIVAVAGFLFFQWQTILQWHPWDRRREAHRVAARA